MSLKVMKVKVRKCKNNENYRFRYREYQAGTKEKDLNLDQINALDEMILTYAPSVSEADKVELKKLWAKKLN